MDLQTQLQDWLDVVNRYFGQLNDVEKYAWLGMTLGFLLVMAGIVLLIL